MAEQLETEFTFEPGPDPALPDLSDIAGVATVTKPRVQRLEAVYFDTDDLRLMRAGVTLRRRTGGDDAGWHLKVPTADDTGRTEVHAPLGRSTRQPPQRLRSAATAWTRDASLIPVATVHTRRLVRRLRDERRALVAELCEDTVRGTRLLEGLDSETTWTEWELELGDAASGDVTDALIARLIGGERTAQHRVVEAAPHARVGARASSDGRRERGQPGTRCRAGADRTSSCRPCASTTARYAETWATACTRREWRCAGCAPRSPPSAPGSTES